MDLMEDTQHYQSAIGDPEPRSPSDPIPPEGSARVDVSTASGVEALYSPLETSRLEIRVLELLPGEGTIATRLHRMYIDEPHEPYSAISYAWGSRQDADTVRINSDSRGVPLKPWEILWNLRYRLAHKTSLRIWLDLLCINQNSIDDKNRQVSLMGEIFCNAETVYACVNNPEVESTLDFRSGESLLASGYWMRRWIVQELGLARQVHIMDGVTTIAWDHFCSRLRESEPEFEVKYVHQWSTFSKIRSLRSQGPYLRSPLHQLLIDFRHTECTEPYDRIYALLSLANVKDRSRIQVDYRKSLFGLFFEVASLIDLDRETANFHVLDVLYSELASKRARHVLSGYRPFASRLPSLNISLIKYYGTVASATSDEITSFSSTPSLTSWCLKVRTELDEESTQPLPETTIKGATVEKWCTVSVSSLKDRPQVGDFCFVTTAFTERILLARRDEGGAVRCYGRAEKIAWDAPRGGNGHQIRYFLRSALFELHSRQPNYSHDILSEHPQTWRYGVLGARFNGAALVESLYRWAPEVTPAGEVPVLDKLKHILPKSVLDELRVMKGGLSTSPAQDARKPPAGPAGASFRKPGPFWGEST